MYGRNSETIELFGAEASAALTAGHVNGNGKRELVVDELRELICARREVAGLSFGQISPAPRPARSLGSRPRGEPPPEGWSGGSGAGGRGSPSPPRACLPENLGG